MTPIWWWANALKLRTDINYTEWQELEEIEWLLNDNEIDEIINEFLRENSWLWNENEVFTPDEWTKAIITAIFKKLKSKNSQLSIMEIGMWSGIIMKFILQHLRKKVDIIIWTDVVEEAVNSSKRNLEWINDEGKWILLLSNLLNDIRDEVIEILDIMYACLPQVILPEWSQRPDDYYAHYYDSDLFEDYEFNKYGFWLLEATIKDFSERSSNAEIYMNFAWRINLETINWLFEKYWYIPDVAYEKIIPQCPTTDLWMFVELEKTNPEALWEFYEDQEWTKIISAKEAEDKRKNWIEIFHKIYVIKWTPKVIYL